MHSAAAGIAIRTPCNNIAKICHLSIERIFPFSAAIGQLTLIALGIIGISLAIIYLGLKGNGGNNGGGGIGSGDPLGDILNDY